MLYYRRLINVKIKVQNKCTFLLVFWFDAPKEILTSCKNQACTVYKIRVMYNINCCMLHYRAIMHVKRKILNSTLKTVYIVGSLLIEYP